MKKLLIIRPEGIGDFVIFTAVLEELTKLYPYHQINLLCHENVLSLAEAIPFVDKVISFKTHLLFKKKHLLFTAWILLKLIFKRYDTVMCPVYTRNKRYDYLVKFIRAKKKIAFDGDNSSDVKDQRGQRDEFYTQIIKSDPNPKDEIERNLEFLNKLGSTLSTQQLSTKVWFKNEDLEKFEKFKKKYELQEQEYIVFVPGAGSSIRYWPKDKWVTLIQNVRKEMPRYKILMVGMSNDIIPINTVLKNLSHEAKGQVLNLYGKTPLCLLAKIIQQAKLCVGLETGAIHIAAAVGTPNVCIMGGGHFKRFYPYGNLSKNRVVYHFMKCFNCDWKCKFEKIECIQRINADNVLNQIIEVSSGINECKRQNNPIFPAQSKCGMINRKKSKEVYHGGMQQ